MRRFLPCALLFAPCVSAQLFSAPSSVSPGPGSVRGFAVGDTNGDGAVDVVVIGNPVRTLLGNGVGGFPSTVVSSVATVQGGLVPTIVHMQDVDADGRLDVIFNDLTAPPSLASGLRLLLGDGNGSFADAAQPMPALPAQPWFTVADYSGDERPDVLAFGPTLPMQASLAAATGAGAFAAFGSVPLPLTVNVLASSSRGLLTADLNGDERLDVVVGGFATTMILLGDGVGRFPTGSTSSLLIPTLIADLNGDSLPDLLGPMVTGGVSHAIAVNDGTGLFAAPLPITTPPLDPLNAWTAAADLDGDGHTDLVSNWSVANAPTVFVQRGDGTGNFATIETYAVDHVGQTAVHDVDRDGRPDVLILDDTGIQVLRNVLPAPTGVVAYGAGTATCGGTIGISANTAPSIGEADFRVLNSNAPPRSSGLLAVGTRVIGGWDPLGWDLTLHLGVALPIGTLRSDGSGTTGFALPIPNVPFLVGLKVHLQSFWIGDARFGNTCSPAMLELASSRGLTITLRP